MSQEPENMVLHLLREMRSEMGTRTDLAKLEGKIADVQAEVRSFRAELKSDMHSLRADVASDLHIMEKRFGDQIVGLRRAVMEYHSTAVGHGMLYSELEDRVRRIEQRLGISPSEAH